MSIQMQITLLSLANFDYEIYTRIHIVPELETEHTLPLS